MHTSSECSYWSSNGQWNANLIFLGNSCPSGGGWVGRNGVYEQALFLCQAWRDGLNIRPGGLDSTENWGVDSLVLDLGAG